MAKSIQEFYGQIAKTGIRTSNMFEMYVSTGYPDVDAVLANITMYGQNFELPTRTIEYNVLGFKAFDVPIAGKFTMAQNHSMTVNADTAGEIRRAFLAWQGKTVNPAITDGSLFEGDRRPTLGSVVRIHLLGNDMSTVAEIYKLVGVKVAEVGAMTVSNTDAGVASFPVTLESLYWEIEAGSIQEGAFKDQK